MDHWLGTLSRSGLKVVSLGSWCGVRGCLQDMGLHEESYPFDNLRISLEGVLHFLETRFKNFVKYETFTDVGQTHGHKVFHCKYHSFWHDKLDESTDREKYKRRTARFLNLAETAQELLFVYACNSSTEVAKGEELLDALTRCFEGATVFLLLLIPLQRAEKLWEVEGRAGRLFVRGCGGLDWQSYAPAVSSTLRHVRQHSPVEVGAVPSCAKLGGALWPFAMSDPRRNQFRIAEVRAAADDEEEEGGPGTIWKVVAGGDKGIVVRSGCHLKSPELPRVAKGARLQEVELIGERLHYRKLEGSGPDWGWVSLTSKGARLLRPEQQPSLKRMKRRLARKKLGRLFRAWLLALQAGDADSDAEEL